MNIYYLYRLKNYALHTLKTRPKKQSKELTVLTWHENVFYNPNAIAEQLKAESVRSPAVRLGGSIYGGAGRDIRGKNAAGKAARKTARPGMNDIQIT
jgi:hypothetical protein